MSYELNKLGSGDEPFPISANELIRRVDELLTIKGRRFRRLAMYYANPMLPRRAERDEQGSDRPYRQGQEWGLPSRVTGVRQGDDPSLMQAVDGVARKEVVIENDIGWRVDTMVDFLFGQPIRIGSLCADEGRRAQIETLLDEMLQQHGGGLLLQQLSLMGAIHGFVDVLVKLDPSAMRELENGSGPASDAARASSGDGSREEAAVELLTPEVGSASRVDDETSPGASETSSLRVPLARMARLIRLEIVDPARALPVLNETDWRDVRAYAQVYQLEKEPTSHVPTSSWLSRVLAQWSPMRGNAWEAKELRTMVEIITPRRWQRYEDETLVAEGDNSLGEIPLVHIQNIAAAFRYDGRSDVEPLIAMQDELNTRLSDRASRITLQSFKMYLGKGIDSFTDLPVAPGRMWMTDNIEAEVIQFGGDSSSPSEDLHITELREAMDKTSGVTPIAAGAIRGRVGNLTSAAALRVTMMSLLAKTERKRTTYGAAIERMCELALAWLDRAGVFRTSPDERRVEIHWPPMMPDSQMDQLREAQIKQSLGVPRDVILRELGYVDMPKSVDINQST